MTDQFDHLRNAARLLAGQRSLRQALPDACSEFWAAMFDPDQWPAELLERANEIVEQILQEGPLRRTLAKLDDATLQQIADDIKQLAAEMESLRGRDRSSDESKPE
jgi:hypothetical protein